MPAAKSAESTSSPSQGAAAETMQTWIGYPEAIEYQGESIVGNLENNPALSGIPLAIIGNVVSRVSWIQSYFWRNASFPKVTEIPQLLDIPPRFHPLVIPVGPISPPFIPFDEAILSPSSAQPSGRYNSAADFHAAYLSGTTTPLAVVESLLPLIEQKQEPRGVYEDAWVTAHESTKLVIEAAKASTERYADGKPLGILDGVPIGVKDDTDVEGWVNHWGMSTDMVNPNYTPCETSLWPVLKLQEVGAIVIGKNSMHELGTGTPTNHFNHGYNPGGSTSGGASAVSVGIVPITVGTDGGGSVRMPASYNGIYGIQPSHHRTFTHPFTMVRHGPLAATVADLTIAYRLMAQPNANDPVQRLYRPSQPPEATARRTIGISSEWWALADPRVAATCRAAVDHLAAEEGYEVVDISIPYLPEGRLAHGLLILGDLCNSARQHAPNTPSSHWLAHLNNLNKLLLSVATQCTAREYLAASAMRELLMRHLAHLFQKHPNLLIVTPTSPLVGWPRGANDDAHGATNTNLSIRNMVYVFLSNLTGTPAATAPVGYVEPDHGEGKMPVGLMALAEWGQEEHLLQWAGKLEKYLHGTYEGGRIKPKAWKDVLATAEEDGGK